MLSIIFIPLTLSLICIALMMLVMVKLWMALSLPWAPLWMVKLSAVALIIALSLMLITGAASVLRSSLFHIKHFFSVPSRRLRQLTRIQVRRQQAHTLFFQKAAQINYFFTLKQKRLLTKDDKRQLDVLTHTIKRDLSVARKKLPKQQAQNLQHQLRKAHKQRDEAALINLQHEIALLANDICQK